MQSEIMQVLDENPIVSEITWTEEPGGASSVVGQFISSTGTKVFRKGGPGGHAKESREVTIENGPRTTALAALTQLQDERRLRRLLVA